MIFVLVDMVWTGIALLQRLLLTETHKSEVSWNYELFGDPFYWTLPHYWLGASYKELIGYI